ncbi:MAG TPA: ferric reductase-like transmembrane domain-containing protein [Amycolatopsis sp.]|uniref:ferric reductase-like transmembrane domain-containing protein n=1 Tax=Amycolatopsis sp. TaxID=37632 RepID=UPI002B47F789|nr:ferric reductase-like transmembrane domain-containing protein [Amycolatopsis sp.]HKS47619.1 ferric reductase-like transmembrane domain-containing protein [Amycolatopsis sp.]
MMSTIVLAQSADTGLRTVAQYSARLSYIFMCFTLTWGVLTATNWVRNITGRKALRGSHMVMATLTLAFGGIHAMAFLFLSSGALSLAYLTVPYFVSGALARHVLGVVGFELMLAIALTAGLYRFTSYRRWLYLHRIAYLAVPITAIHSFFGAIANGNLALDWLVGTILLVPVLTLTALRFLPTRALERIGLIEEQV